MKTNFKKSIEFETQFFDDNEDMCFLKIYLPDFVKALDALICSTKYMEEYVLRLLLKDKTRFDDVSC